MNLLKSYSDSNINADEEIKKHINKFKTAKNVASNFGLSVSDNSIEENIGRYVQFKTQKNSQQGSFSDKGAIYEIVGTQKHWGYVDGKYVNNKIGYRLATVGKDSDFGSVGDVDEVKFIKCSEPDAIKVNNFINNNWKLKGQDWINQKKEFVSQTGINF